MLTADGGSGDRCRERGSEGTINSKPNAGSDEDKVGRVVAKMTVTKMTDNKVSKMIARIQEMDDTMTSDQLQTVIVEIQEDGGDRRGEMYKDEGAGLDNTFEDRVAGLDDVFEGKGAGLEDRRQDRHYHLLADLRLVEAHGSASHRFSSFLTKAPHRR